jgi:hypothetical protein
MIEGKHEKKEKGKTTKKKKKMKNENEKVSVRDTRKLALVEREGEERADRLHALGSAQVLSVLGKQQSSKKNTNGGD